MVHRASLSAESATGAKLCRVTHYFMTVLVLNAGRAGSSIREVTMEGEAKERRVYVVEWKDAYSNGIDQVDEQHKHLFFLVKCLKLETIEKTLDELADYVFSHFSTEQKLMEESVYPDRERHRQIHDQFVSNVAECIANDNPWDDKRLHELRKFLNKWLIGHIMTDDQQFGRWYKQYQYQQNFDAARISEDDRGFLSHLFKPDWMLRLLGK
jgi:hemerythrin